MKRPVTKRVTDTLDAVERTVAAVAIRTVGILGALAFVSLSLYEFVRFTKDVWSGR
jgi:hypothetical protein